MPQLNEGDPFPGLSVALPGGATAELPSDLAGDYAVVLLFRGAWCPYCNAQLSAFQRAADELAGAGVRVVALSTEDEATTIALVAKHGLEFPVGHSADVREIHAATGAFVNEERPNIEATGFVLSPEGRVLVAVYSTRAIGRLVPDDVVRMVRHHRERMAQAAG